MVLTGGADATVVLAIMEGLIMMRVVSTAHDCFKDPALYADVPLVVDTRNMLAPLHLPPGRRPRVVRA